MRLKVICEHCLRVTAVPKSAMDTAVEELLRKIAASEKQLPPEAQQILYENLWSLYAD